MIADAGQVLDTSAANQHHRMFLQFVAFTRDVGINLHLVGQPDPGYLAQRRIRLLGCHGPDLGTDAPLLR